MQQDIYVSTDVETDGPLPSLNSMLSLGSVAYTETGEQIGQFCVNLELLPDAAAHPVTERWWRDFPQAWQIARQDAKPPALAMREYLGWVKALPGRPVFVAFPTGFDFSFVNWYLGKFVGEFPFGFAALDVRSFAMGVLARPFRDTTKERLPREWFGPSPHTHVALEDAIEQGELFVSILRASRARGDSL